MFSLYQTMRNPFCLLSRHGTRRRQYFCDPRKKGYAVPDGMIRAVYEDPYRPDLLEPAHLTTNLPFSRIDPLTTAPDLIQFFIKTLQGRTIRKRIWKERRIQELKYEIQRHLGISSSMQSLIYGWPIMQDNHTLPVQRAPVLLKMLEQMQWKRRKKPKPNQHHLHNYQHHLHNYLDLTLWSKNLKY